MALALNIIAAHSHDSAKPLRPVGLMLVENTNVVHVIITGTAGREEFAVVDTGTEMRSFNLVTAKGPTRTILGRIVS